MKLKWCFFVIFSWSLIGCKTKTKVSIDLTNVLLPNGKHLVVEKENKETTYTGVFTKHNYGTAHFYSYRLSLNDDEVFWNGGSGEPKHLLFCSDSIFIHYLKEKSIREEYRDTLDTIVKYKYHDEVLHVFEKFVDNRYIFNWFGEAFWVEIPATSYKQKRVKCEEFEVPNDNELKVDINYLQ